MEKPSKICCVCEESFEKHYQLSYKQWSKVKYCSRKCMGMGKRHSREDWEKSFHSRYTRGPVDQCWLWQGGRCEKGYGMATRLGGGTKRAPRVAYELHYGVDPGELLVCHKCDNPPCVNPHHLFLGTDKDNCADKIAKGRLVVQIGDEKPNAKIGWAGARLVKRVSIPATKLAPILGVSETAVRNIRQGKTWKHITP